MSGPITHSKSRRIFLISSSALTLSSLAYFTFSKNQSHEKSIPFQSHDQASRGHRLRESWNSSDYIFSHQESLSILGAGISGLSCAYFLSQSGQKDFSIYDLGPMAGGNCAYFSSPLSRASWGAHYLPIPSIENKELLDFLFKHRIITSWEKGLPIYEEEFLCHDPKERLLIRGAWQDSLRPLHGLDQKENEELDRFLSLTEKLKWQKGSDGRWLFDIPVDKSSQQSEFLALDKISFSDWLTKEGYTGSALHWLCNYSCLDDFGTPISKTSAWAGLHYFCSRRSEAVLVWPEGNGFLKDALESHLPQPAKTSSLVRKVEKTSTGFRIYIDDQMTGRKYFVNSKSIVYCLPRYTAPTILGVHYPLSTSEIQSYPWLVAHLEVRKAALEERSELTWDTVKFGEKSLGYINNNHQSTNPNLENVLITFYSAFSEETPPREREKLRSMSEEELKLFIISEMKKLHPEIEKDIHRIDAKIIGHAMISPSVDFIWNHRKKVLPRTHNGIIFAHSEMSGMSLFEEAFYQGHCAFLELERQRQHPPASPGET